MNRLSLLTRFSVVTFALVSGAACASTPRASVLPSPAAAAATPVAVPSNPPPPTTRQRPAADAATLRLARLARIWGDVQYRHPYLWENRGIDWDAALARAIPAIRNAASPKDEAAAVQQMLDALHDPITRVEANDAAAAAWTSTKHEVPEKGGVALLTLEDISAPLETVRKNIGSARTIVLDLRSAQPNNSNGALDALAPLLVSHDCATAPIRSVLHSGYRPQRDFAGGQYFSASMSRMPRAYDAVKGSRALKVVAIVNAQTVVPDVVLAMQRVGDAKVVADGRLKSFAEWTRDEEPLPDGSTAFLRNAEADGNDGPDLTGAHGTAAGTDAAFDAAIRLATKGWQTVAKTEVAPAMRWRPDATYADESFPPLEHRVLAVFRVWNVIRLFYPYLALMHAGDWDDVLTEFLPRMEAVTNAHEYALAVAELAGRIPDSHVTVSSPELKRFFGRPLSGFTLHEIEGQPVVVQAGTAEKAAGLRLGDVLLAIDGESFAARVERMRPYVAASNPWSLTHDAYYRATGGAPGSDALLHVRGADGKERDVHLSRADAPPTSPPAKDAHYKLVEGGTIGYADLNTLRRDEVDAMFVAFANTRGIVFDMRGYPNGTAWSIAPHLNVRNAPLGTELAVPIVGFGTGSDVPGQVRVGQELPRAKPPLYTGKTVMLIDEETVSQAEHTALFFEAANGTKLIGSPSAGADGNVTNMSVPGGMYIDFTGLGVAHADGRQLQRVGLHPDVEVRPTIVGLAAGRDEVLERALSYLRAGR